MIPSITGVAGSWNDICQEVLESNKAIDVKDIGYSV